MSAFVLAELAVPTAGQCFQVLAPVAALVLLNWIIGHTDEIIHRWFPNLEWERQLGWLNIRSERRAAAFLRTFGYGVYALLAVALCGIVWGAVGVSRLRQGQDAQVLAEFSDRLPVLFTSIGIWAIYLAGHLLPRLKREYEEEELERFRAETAVLEERSAEHTAARTPHGPLLGAASSLAKPPRSGPGR